MLCPTWRFRYGSRNEGLDAIAGLLDEVPVALKAQRSGVPPPLWICAGRSFTPSREWAMGCVLRIEVALGGFLALLAVKETMNAYGELDAGDASDALLKSPAFWIQLVTIVLTLVVMSGFLPLFKFNSKLILPRRLRMVGLRNRLTLFFVVWVDAIQPFLLATAFGLADKAQQWTDHKATVVAVEMLAIQLFSHRVFVGPPFEWRFPRPPLLATMARFNNHAFDEAVSQGGMRSAVKVAAENLEFVVAAHEVEAALNGTLEREQLKPGVWELPGQPPRSVPAPGFSGGGASVTGDGSLLPPRSLNREVTQTSSV